MTSKNNIKIQGYNRLKYSLMLEYFPNNLENFDCEYLCFLRRPYSFSKFNGNGKLEEIFEAFLENMNFDCTL